jgi:RNA polymerase sigma factor (sigma-70 family)
MIHKDQKYINGLLNNDSRIIDEIYKKFTKKIIAFVCKNNGNESDAKDLIQDVILLIYDQAKTKGLQLSCPFDAYFFLICKRKWFTILKKKSRNRVTEEPLTGFIAENLEEAADQTMLFEEKTALFQEVFEKLGDACKKLLKLTLTIKSMDEVAKKLGVSYGYARKKKSLCMGQLTKWVQESNVFDHLKKH